MRRSWRQSRWFLFQFLLILANILFCFVIVFCANVFELHHVIFLKQSRLIPYNSVDTRIPQSCKLNPSSFIILTLCASYICVLCTAMMSTTQTAVWKSKKKTNSQQRQKEGRNWFGCAEAQRDCSIILHTQTEALHGVQGFETSSERHVRTAKNVPTLAFREELHELPAKTCAVPNPFGRWWYHWLHSRTIRITRWCIKQFVETSGVSCSIDIDSLILVQIKIFVSPNPGHDDFIIGCHNCIWWRHSISSRIVVI